MEPEKEAGFFEKNGSHSWRGARMVYNKNGSESERAHKRFIIIAHFNEIHIINRKKI